MRRKSRKFEVSLRKKYKAGEITMIKIKLVKSLNGRLKKHIATANSLGLRKIGDSTEQQDNPQTRGKIKQIAYLLTVEQ